MIKVKAKVTGTHALTGLSLQEGEVYEVDEEIAKMADQVFEIPPPETQDRQIPAPDDEQGKKNKKQKEE